MEGEEQFMNRCPCCGRKQTAYNKNKKDPYIHQLSLEAKHEELCNLLKQGTDVNAISQIDMSYPIHRAAESGSIECAQVLLAHGALIDAKDSSGKTPLHKVAYM